VMDLADLAEELSDLGRVIVGHLPEM
jgi:hypothetical protein